MSPSRVFALLCVASACGGAGHTRSPASPAPIDDAAVQRMLVDNAQSLVDAVTNGSKATWERLADPGLVYVAEDGSRQTKQSILSQIQPLPPGISGKLTVQAPQFHRHGDTAVLTYDVHEVIDYFGHPLDVIYRITDTWVSKQGEWKLVAAQVHAALADPAAITLPPARLDDYVGVYALTKGITYTIRRDGDGLTGERSGRPVEPLRAEAPDVLFVPGQFRIRKVFTRGADGKVTGFVDRREARDVPWTRQP